MVGGVGKGAVLALALALVSVVQPVQAAASTATTPPEHGAFDARKPGQLSFNLDEATGTLSTAHPTRHPAEAWAATVGDPATALDASAYVRAAIATLEDGWGVDLPTALAGGGVPDPEPHPEDEDHVGTARWPFGIGDIDGDGLDDVAVLETLHGPGLSIDGWRVRALHGTDGSERWATDLGPAYATIPLPAELTGDGVVDVLLLAFDVTSYDGGRTCAPLDTCRAGEELAYRWTVRVLSGADGSDRWSRSWEGRTRLDAADGTVARWNPSTGTVSATGLGAVLVEDHGFVVPTRAGDVDGDGAGDVVVNAYGLARGLVFGAAGSQAAGLLAFGDVQRYTTRAEVVSGPTGQAVHQRTRELSEGLGSLSALPRPGGGADLLWREVRRQPTVVACAGVVAAGGQCAGTARLTFSAERLDGRTFAPRWQLTRDDPDLLIASATEAFADLDDDGVGDLFLSELLDGDTASRPRLSALSGARGTPLWSRDTPAMPIALGAMGGSPGADLALADFVAHDGPDGVVVEVRLERVDGATGSDLFATTKRRQLRFGGSGSVGLVPDGDGDGVDDVAVVLREFAAVPQSHTDVESGGRGTTLYAASAPGLGTVSPAGDLDGDGAADVVDGRFVLSGGSTLALAAVSLRTGAVLWQHTDAGSAYGGGFGFLAGMRLFDTASTDAVLNRVDMVGGTVLSRVEAIDGATGAGLWVQEDAAPGGGISGTVSDTSGVPLASVCVTAVLPSRILAHTGMTDHKGRYAFDGMAPGEYRLHFADCGGRGLVSEFHRDQRVFERAEPVVVVGERRTRVGNTVMDVQRVVRTETKTYVGPAGTTVTPVCSGVDVGVGGACFELDWNDGEVALDARDHVAPSVSGTFAFVHDNGVEPDEVLWSGEFCPGPTRLWVPPLADRLEVRLGAQADIACAAREATAGTVTATVLSGS